MLLAYLLFAMPEFISFTRFNKVLVTFLSLSKSALVTAPRSRIIASISSFLCLFSINRSAFSNWSVVAPCLEFVVAIFYSAADWDTP